MNDKKLKNLLFGLSGYLQNVSSTHFKIHATVSSDNDFALMFHPFISQ
jgi:hypothetical protein